MSSVRLNMSHKMDDRVRRGDQMCAKYLYLNTPIQMSSVIVISNNLVDKLTYSLYSDHQTYKPKLQNF